MYAKLYVSVEGDGIALRIVYIVLRIERDLYKEIYVGDVVGAGVCVVRCAFVVARWVSERGRSGGAGALLGTATGKARMGKTD